MLSVINAFRTAYRLTDVTIVADAGMISEANQVALQAAGLSYILGARIPHLPDVVRQWRDKHPDEAIPDGLTLTEPWPSTSSEKSRVGLSGRQGLLESDRKVLPPRRRVEGSGPHT